MQLAGSDVRCVRGGREVFAALDFAVDGGEVLAVTGRHRRLQCLGVASEHGHLRAIGDKAFGDRPANAATAASNECVPAFKSHAGAQFSKFVLCRGALRDELRKL